MFSIFKHTWRAIVRLFNKGEALKEAAKKIQQLNTEIKTLKEQHYELKQDAVQCEKMYKTTSQLLYRHGLYYKWHFYKSRLPYLIMLFLDNDTGNFDFEIYDSNWKQVANANYIIEAGVYQLQELWIESNSFTLLIDVVIKQIIRRADNEKRTIRGRFEYIYPENADGYMYFQKHLFTIKKDKEDYVVVERIYREV